MRPWNQFVFSATNEIQRMSHRSVLFNGRTLRFPGDHLVNQIHYAQCNKQPLVSINNADKISKYANRADEYSKQRR
jgi:hypothetical protein